MDVSDRTNWILSGLVGALLVGNGLVRIPSWSSPLELVLIGALVTGGLLATVNAVEAVQDPSEENSRDWTQRKTTLNALAVVLLTGTLVVELFGLVAA